MDNFVMGYTNEEKLSIREFCQYIVTRTDVNDFTQWFVGVRPLSPKEMISDTTSEELIERITTNKEQVLAGLRGRAPISKTLSAKSKMSSVKLPDDVNVQIDSTSVFIAVINYAFSYNSGAKNSQHAFPTPFTIMEGALVSHYQRRTSGMFVEVSIPLDELEYVKNKDFIPNMIYNLQSTKGTTNVRTREHSFIFKKNGEVLHIKGSAASTKINADINYDAQGEFRDVGLQIQTIRSKTLLAEIMVSHISLEDIFPTKKSQKTFPIVFVVTPNDFKIVAETENQRKPTLYLNKDEITKDTHDVRIHHLPDKPISCRATMLGLGGMGKTIISKVQGNIIIRIRDKMNDGCYYCEIITPLSKANARGFTFLKLIPEDYTGKPMTVERMMVMRKNHSGRTKYSKRAMKKEFEMSLEKEDEMDLSGFDLRDFGIFESKKKDDHLENSPIPVEDALEDFSIYGDRAKTLSNVEEEDSVETLSNVEEEDSVETLSNVEEDPESQKVSRIDEEDGLGLGEAGQIRDIDELENSDEELDMGPIEFSFSNV